jgi:hypothetical protein
MITISPADKEFACQIMHDLQQQPKLDEHNALLLLRISYILASESLKQAKNFIGVVEKLAPEFQHTGQYQQQHIFKSYYAAMLAVQARLSFNPFEQFAMVNSALDKLDILVHKHPENTEIRFVRASIGYHLPFFFNRLIQAEKDLQMIAEKIQTISKNYDPLLTSALAQFLLQTNCLTKKQRQAVANVQLLVQDAFSHATKK